MRNLNYKFQIYKFSCILDNYNTLQQKLEGNQKKKKFDIFIEIKRLKKKYLQKVGNYTNK